MPGCGRRRCLRPPRRDDRVRRIRKASRSQGKALLRFRSFSERDEYGSIIKIRVRRVLLYLLALIGFYKEELTYSFFFYFFLFAWPDQIILCGGGDLIFDLDMTWRRELINIISFIYPVTFNNRRKYLC